MASFNIDIGRRARHHVQPQEQFEVQRGAGRRNAAGFERSNQAGQFSNKFSRSFRASPIGTREKKYLSVLVRISNQSDDGIRLAGGPAESCGDILRLLVRTRVEIAYYFLSGIVVIDQVEIQLVAEE